MGIGVILSDRGLISPPQLREALAEQRTTGERLDKILVRLGFVSAEDVLHALGEQFHMDVVDLATADVSADALQTLPAQLVFKQRCVPVAKEGSLLTVATSDPFELSVLDELRMLTGCAVELVLADEDEIGKFIREHYGVGGDTLDAMRSADERTSDAFDIDASDAAQDEIEQAQEASVVKLVNDLLLEAVQERATDVHIEPYEHELAVRYRIDGVLQRANVPPAINRYASAIISRLKIMASLNIAEKRRPQDGRITFKARVPGPGRSKRAEEFDLRVSVIPMLFGEGVVLRVLNKSAVLMRLEDLGMPAHVAERWSGLIQRPHGIVLVTGPTGSGKSTTLYASLNQIVSDEVKCITVEDPVEYHVPGVNQIQVNHKVGLSFSAGLRSILRHDPDAVMVGEIRDKETAETAVQASLTGHVVFSTLHTNDSAGAVTRLIDMGVEPFLIASSVEGVLAQRLVRRICPDCEAAYEPDPADLPPGFTLRPGQTLSKGEGCRNCRGTGYRGRLGIYELLRLTPPLRDLIMDRVNAPAIADRALADGELTTLRQDGYAKALDRKTTITEVMRALSA